MGYRMHLPPGTKVSEETVLRRFISNIKRAASLGDSGSIAALQRSEARLAEIAADKRALAARLMHRRLP